MRAFILITLLVLITKLYAQEENWKTFTEDQDNAYYVGISDGRMSLREAMDEAYLEAVKEAIRHQFGFTQEYIANAIETTDRILIDNSSKITVAGINLVGISALLEDVIKNVDGSYIVKRKIKYPKTEIEKERRRKKSSSATLFNEYRSGEEHASEFEITTIPSGAIINLLGVSNNIQMGGTSNAKMFVPPGTYFVELTLPNYKSVNERSIVGPQGGRFFKRLSPLKGSVKLKINPEDARVLIDGKNESGRTLELDATKRYSIKVDHPDYFSYSSEIEVTPETEKEYPINLVPRSGHISIASNPSGARLFVDDKFIGATPIKNVRVDAGKRVIRLEKSGFEILEKEYIIAPNRVNPSLDLKLSKEKEIKYEFKNPFKEREERRSYWSFDYTPIRAGTESLLYWLPFGFQYHGENHFTAFFDFAYTLADEKNENGETAETDTTELTFGYRYDFPKKSDVQLSLGLELMNRSKSYLVNDYQGRYDESKKVESVFSPHFHAEIPIKNSPMFWELNGRALNFNVGHVEAAIGIGWNF